MSLPVSPDIAINPYFQCFVRRPALPLIIGANRGEQVVGKGWLRRGGANNSANRTSQLLTEYQARRLIGGCKAAYDAGLGMNRFVTISWGLAGLSPQESVAATGEWIRLAREWLRDRGTPCAWVWVQECGPKLGAHCHILIHVPDNLAPLFSGKPRQWAAHIIARRGGRYASGTILTRKIAGSSADQALPEAFEAALMGRLHYLLKGTPARLERPLGMTKWGHVPWGQSCLVYGKRAAVWQHRTRKLETVE